MVLTKEVMLPSEQELTVKEVEISTPGLRAASFHMGKVCENVNNVRANSYNVLTNFKFFKKDLIELSNDNVIKLLKEFMLCRQEYKDPRHCLNEGKAVTACSLNFFREIKKNCAEEFTQFAKCLDLSSTDFSFSP